MSEYMPKIISNRMSGCMYGMVWYGIVWYRMVSCGIVWYGMASHSIAYAYAYVYVYVYVQVYVYVYVYVYVCAIYVSYMFPICFQMICQKLCQNSVSGWGSLEVK